MPEADRARAGWLQVTGLAVSDRHPYMFSCGLDKMVKCWDLEYNKARPPSRTPNILRWEYSNWGSSTLTRRTPRVCGHYVML